MSMLKAYSVQETCEGTGGIVFAKHNVVARKKGSQQFADGDFGSVTCNRAPWADEFAERGSVPASEAIHHGWWFECHGCGRKIDEDLPSLWESEVRNGEPLKGQQLLYAQWRPEHVIGNMDTAIFCRKSCKDHHDAHERERKRRQKRAIEAFKRIILKRFPDVTFPPDPECDAPYYRRSQHAYAEKRGDRWRLTQIIVYFNFPGMAIAPASLEYRFQSDTPREKRKPAYHCCNGDREAFEAWANPEKAAA